MGEQATWKVGRTAERATQSQHTYLHEPGLCPIRPSSAGTFCCSMWPSDGPCSVLPSSQVSVTCSHIPAFKATPSVQNALPHPCLKPYSGKSSGSTAISLALVMPSVVFFPNTGHLRASLIPGCSLQEHLLISGTCTLAVSILPICAGGTQVPKAFSWP